MEASDLIQKGNSLQVNLTVSYNNDTVAINTIKEYKIIGAAVFQVKVIGFRVDNYGPYSNLIFVKFVKLHQEDELTYIIKFTSEELSITDKCFISDVGTWHLVKDNIAGRDFYFNITVQMEICPDPSACSLKILHDDTETTDFELKGEDGSICMHRAVLAAASPVLKAMLSGKWRETTDGEVDIPGTSKAALQSFKDYLYLHTLPKVGLDLEQLLLLSSYYMIEDLEQKCAFKIVSMITAENVCDLLEFATKHKVKRLLLAILECVKGGAVEVDEVRNHLLHSKASED